jgi:peroxiredoxin
MQSMSLLQNGNRFPAISAPKAGGGTLSLPGDLAGSFGVVLFYRGSWCPYCNAQLSRFEGAKERLTSVGIKVAALSVDDEATTRGLIAKHKISFPMGYGADARAIAAATGAYLNEDPLYLQTTGFVLAPDGTVVNAVYSSAAIGRLVAEDVVGLVSYLKSKA